MGLSRSSSGLLLRDDFGSDTESNYTLAGHDHFGVTGGAMVYTPDGGGTAGSNLRRTDISTAKMMTALAKQSSAWGSYEPVTVGSSGDGDPTYHTANGYKIQTAAASATYVYLLKTNGGTETELDNANTSSRSLGTLYYWRVYIYGTSTVTVKGLHGASTLSEILTADDSSSPYTSGHIAFYAQDLSGRPEEWDWVEARTSHLITCSGMTTGHYLRVSDGTTTAEAQESSGTASVNAALVLFPLSSVQIRTASGGGGSLVAEITSATLTDMGGGDAFTYSAGTPTPTIDASLSGSNIQVSWS